MSNRNLGYIERYRAEVRHEPIKNSIVGGTVSTFAAGLFFAYQGCRIAMPYTWFCAVLAALSYSFLATRFSIYGKAHIVFSNWKNLLLTLSLFIGTQIGDLKLEPLFSFPPNTSTAVSLAVLAAIGLSDALAG